MRMLIWRLLSFLTISWFVCFALAPLCRASETTSVPNSVFELGRFETRLEDRPYSLQYLLFQPQADATPEKGFPTILFLHGSGARGTNAAELAAHHMPTVLEDKPDFPFMVVAPQCPPDGWWRGELLERVGELLDDISTHYPVDTNRVYLTGLSMGGYGTWDMMRLFPDRFAAFASVCGGKGRENLAGFAHVPGRAYHGDADPIVPCSNTLSIVEAFREVGGHIDLTIYPGVGHGAWTPTYDTPELFLWMLRHSKNAPPKEPALDAKTQAFFSGWNTAWAYKNNTTPGGYRLDAGAQDIVIARSNCTDTLLRETLQWETSEAWSIEPAQATLILAPGECAEARFTGLFTNTPERLNPVPICHSRLLDGDSTIARFQHRLEIQDGTYFIDRAPTTSAWRVATPPRLDGLLEPEEWPEMPAITGLVQPDASGPFHHNLTVWFTWDNERLYAAFRVAPQPARPLLQNKTERDSSVYQDDSIELYLQPDPKTNTYYHLVLNSIGTLMDGCAHDRSWNADLQSAHALSDEIWTGEISITWASLGLSPPQPGKALGLQFTCMLKNPSDTGQWTPAYGWAHQPTRFGRLLLQGN